MISASIAAQIGPWLARLVLLLTFIVLAMIVVKAVEAAITALQKWWGSDDDG